MRDMARGFDECPFTTEKYSTFSDVMLHIFAQADRRDRVSTSQSGGTRKKWPGRAYFSKMESDYAEGGFFGEGGFTEGSLLEGEMPQNTGLSGNDSPLERPGLREGRGFPGRAGHRKGQTSEEASF